MYLNASNFSILVVRFATPEGSQWAINKFNKRIFNGRELHVTFTVESTQESRKRFPPSKWESTNLHKIDESNNGDEEHEQETTTNE